MNFIIAKVINESGICYKVLDSDNGQVKTVPKLKLLDMINNAELQISNAEIIGERLIGLNSITDSRYTSKQVIIATVKDDNKDIGYMVATWSGEVNYLPKIQVDRMCGANKFQNASIKGSDELYIIGRSNTISKEYKGLDLGNEAIYNVIQEINKVKQKYREEQAHKNRLDFERKMKSVHKGYYLYKFFNADNELLYIGKTINLRTRYHGHMLEGKWKITDVERVEYAECKSKVELQIYELYYVAKLKPLKNKDITGGEELSITLPELEFIDIGKA